MIAKKYIRFLITISLVGTIICLCVVLLIENHSSRPFPGNTNAPVTIPPGKEGSVLNGSWQVKKYISINLGIRFTYPVKQGNSIVLVHEIGNRIYVYTQDQTEDEQHFVEVRYRNAHDSITTAIQKQILTGFPTDKCYVQTADTYAHGVFPKTYTIAFITYPATQDMNGDPYLNGKICPPVYTSDVNGGAYFVTDTMHPSLLLFFHTGHTPLSVASDKTWEETVNLL